MENIQEVFDILKTDSESKNLIDRFEKYLNKIYNEFYSKLITQNNQIETYMSDNSKLKSDIKDLNHQIHSLKTELINNQNSNSTAYTTLEKSKNI